MRLSVVAFEILRVFDACLGDASAPPIRTDEATSVFAIDIDLRFQGSVAQAGLHLVTVLSRQGIRRVAVPPWPDAGVHYFTGLSPKGWQVRVVEARDSIVTASIWFRLEATA